MYQCMHSKSAVLQVTLWIVDWSKWILVEDIVTQFSLALFDCIHCLTNFAKNINSSQMVSLWWELFCKLSIYTLKSAQWITIWWAKFELKCLLLIFITPIQNSKSLAKMRTSNASKSYQRKKHLKFLILHSPFFFHTLYIAILSTLESTSLDETIRSQVCYYHKCVTYASNTQVCYLRTTHSSAL